MTFRYDSSNNRTNKTVTLFSEKLAAVCSCYYSLKALSSVVCVTIEVFLASEGDPPTMAMPPTTGVTYWRVLMNKETRLYCVVL